MLYTITDIAGILQVASPASEAVIEHLLIDSRKIVFPERSLFFALSGERRDGHAFIREVYQRGVRNFVVKKGFAATNFQDAVFLEVNDVLKALQQLAAFHRSRFSIPVIGITGSNGKTIVKEWLYQLLQRDHQIVRSPRSYNSQVGVPLSVWQMNEEHTLAIFEAGISTVDEMKALEAIIRPTIGVFTNISGAHSEGFDGDRAKALEKALLFQQAATLVFAQDALHPYIDPAGKDAGLFDKNIRYHSWGRGADAVFRIQKEERKNERTELTGSYDGQNISFVIPFTDEISVSNAITCCTVMLSMRYTPATIQERILQLAPVNMRMQLTKGINNCYILNDSYSNDLASLGLALDYLQQQAGTQPTTIIVSDLFQTGKDEQALYRELAQRITARNIHRLIGIGPAISKHAHLFDHAGRSLVTVFYPTTDAFLSHTATSQFSNEYILLKGARIFEFEKISHWLEQKVHQTVMEIDLTAMIHNLKEYQSLLRPTTKLMAMVKAFSYGSGSAEVARVLQFHKVDYLAVAYADEGVELRKAGISLPVMVMNVDEAGFDAMVTYALEPEIYSFTVYHSFHQYLRRQGLQQFPVHIKFNTGMNRLGFEVSEAAELAKQIHAEKTMAVKSVFSHLAASESPEHDTFTRHQVHLFENACDQLRETIGYDFIKHIANSAAIHRTPQYQFDMVRLGIGLYGVDSGEGDAVHLDTVAVLKTTIAQIRKVPAGETVGYGRKGKLERDTLVATVRIGYADGYHRKLGNGAGKMWLNQQLVPVIGNVCMDMTMLDVTDVAAKEGDIVEVFGKNLSIHDLAVWAGTIPYEIMTGISQRVKREYIEE